MSSLPESSPPFLLAIIGGGIAGIALSKALSLHSIHSIVFEKDTTSHSRSQGYGLTMQQGSKVLKILKIAERTGDVSQWADSHFIFNKIGKIIIYWGLKAPTETTTSTSSTSNKKKKENRNLQITRYQLRNILFESLDKEYSTFKWDSKLIKIQEKEDKRFKITFLNSNNIESSYIVDAVVGCDGIYSSTINYLSSPPKPLGYLGVIVILGITPIFPEWQLLVHRIIQASDGSSRMFIMPFDDNNIMWQFSYPCDLEVAKSIANDGIHLKEESLKKLEGFFFPIPQMVEATDPTLITGYPVYDRDPYVFDATSNLKITLLGDAAHCMSPFKGQGANQALLDAVSLSDYLNKNKKDGDFDVVKAFREHEIYMTSRCTSKVLDSRNSVNVLHCLDFLSPANQLERRGFTSSDKLLDKIENLKLNNITALTPPHILDKETIFQ